MSLNIRIMVLIAYGLFLLAGMVLLLWRPVPPLVSSVAFQAARKLPAGHLLVPGDVVAVGAPAGYLKAEVAEKKPIAAGDTAAVPPLAAKKGFVPVAFSVAADHVLKTGAINADKPVDLCKDKTAALAGAKVRFALCGPDVAQCVAVVDIPADKTDVLKAIDTLTVRPAAGVNLKPCE